MSTSYVKKTKNICFNNRGLLAKKRHKNQIKMWSAPSVKSHFYQNWKIVVRIGSLVRRDWLWVQILYNISDTIVMSV